MKFQGLCQKTVDVYVRDRQLGAIVETVKEIRCHRSGRVRTFLPLENQASIPGPIARQWLCKECPQRRREAVTLPAAQLALVP
jgi:hypothetical protein